MDLNKSWAITRYHLEQARSLLTSPSFQADQVESLAFYREFIDHNELECALDQLEMIGESCSCSPDFWKELELAALNMGLKDRLKKYEVKIRPA